MKFKFAAKLIVFFILFSCSANAKDWRKASLDIYVSVEVPWGMDRTDSAGVIKLQESFGSRRMIITRAETGGERPEDRADLEARYSSVISGYIQKLNGRLTDSSTFVANEIIGKKLQVAYRHNDSDFVAEAMFILGNNQLYSIEYRHAVAAARDPEAERALSSFGPTELFTPDRQFEKRRRNPAAFEHGFELGMSFGLIVGVCLVAYFLLRWVRRNKPL